MPSYREVRLHLAKDRHTAVAVIWVYNDSAIIGAIERGSLPPLRSERTFASTGQALEAARSLWLSSLTPEPVRPRVFRSFAGNRSTS